MATMVECKTCLGIEDVYDLLEIIRVDGYNRRIIRENEEARHKVDGHGN